MRTRYISNIRPKRRNFVTIQNSRTTNSEGSHLPPTRTGYEFVLPYRTPDLYATMATEPGQVVSITENAITVKYKSGKTETVELGKRDGKWSGKVIPHEVKTDLREGQKIEAGTAIAYNPLFFTQDTLSGQLGFKTGVLCRVGLIEDEYTYEDSSEIASSFASKLGTKNCEVRTISVPFDKDIVDLLKVGTKVEYDTILAVLRNDLGGVGDRFSKDSMDALRDISSLTPRAKNNGVITNITAVYAGDVEDMSPTLQALTSKTDKKLYQRAKDLGQEKVTGQLKPGTRRNGVMLSPNTVLIDVTIDVEQEMSNGSKLVFGHQMKSVVSNVFEEEFTTQDGQPYDAKFSATSNIKRIVESSTLTGICNTFSVEIGRAACEIYEQD